MEYLYKHIIYAYIHPDHCLARLTINFASKERIQKETEKTTSVRKAASDCHGTLDARAGI